MIRWECFCDESYYCMWAVRPAGEKRWGYCFHLNNREEAEGLRNILNKSEQNTALLYDALLSLFDEQKGSPLLSRENQWRDAMIKSSKILRQIESGAVNE